jgi:N-methylhydantoinase A
VGALPLPVFPKIGAGGDPAACIIGSSRVLFEAAPVDCPVYDRERLGAGDKVAGPAIFRQIDTTIVLLPGQTAMVDDHGCLIIREDSAG